jgi:hypothetical protein
MFPLDPASGPGEGPRGQAVEKALTAMAGGDGHPNDVLDELARARVLVPLPTGPRPVIDGSAVALPIAEASLPVYPEGVAYLAGEEVRVGRRHVLR